MSLVSTSDKQLANQVGPNAERTILDMELLISRAIKERCCARVRQVELPIPVASRSGTRFDFS